jgi:hypothetical protein
MQDCGVFRRAVACDSAQRIVSWIACHRAAGCQARSRRSCSRAARSAGSSAEFSPSPFVVCIMSGDLVDSRSPVGEPRSVSAVAGLRAKQPDKRSYPRHRATVFDAGRCLTGPDRSRPASHDGRPVTLRMMSMAPAGLVRQNTDCRVSQPACSATLNIENLNA